MTPNEFISEVYRRGAQLMPNGPTVIEPADFMRVDRSAVALYSAILPADKSLEIVDIGSGDGEFLAVSERLGYQSLTAADFRAVEKFKLVCQMCPAIRAQNFSGTIAEHFSTKPAAFNLIHFAHVVEHIPKYDLLETMDALWKSLRPGGMIVVRTPNMEGPGALSSLYVTLAHEYGFAGANLKQLLHVCGFQEIEFFDPDRYAKMTSRLVRFPFKAWLKLKSRFFGCNVGGQFGAELVAIAKRPNN